MCLGLAGESGGSGPGGVWPSLNPYWGISLFHMLGADIHGIHTLH